jgi:hypothetical protein
MGITLTQLNEYLTVMFGTFRQSVPPAPVQQVILEQVGHLPAEFFKWACRRMADMDQLPRNPGKILSGELWREWRASHPEKVSRELRTCRDCSGRFDVAGSGFYAWAQDEAGQWWEFFLPCHCMRLPAGLKARQYTKAEAEAEGCKLIPPGYAGTLLEFSHRMRQGCDMPAPGSVSGVRPGQAGINPAAFVGVDSQRRDPSRFVAMGEQERLDALGW